jgi:predicted amidohydrolase
MLSVSTTRSTSQPAPSVSNALLTQGKKFAKPFGSPPQSRIEAQDTLEDNLVNSINSAIERGVSLSIYAGGSSFRSDSKTARAASALSEFIFL